MSHASPATATTRPRPPNCSLDLYPKPEVRTTKQKPEAIEPVAPLPNLLATVRFGSKALTWEDTSVVTVPLELADPETQTEELWHSRLAAQRDVSEGVSYGEDGNILYGHSRIGESHLDDVEEATRRAYMAILRVMARRDYPHLIRVWNYLSDIRKEDKHRAGLTRYRRFNRARHHILSRVPDFERHLPAATTVGTPEYSGLVICFLASRVPGEPIENPRQVSAFRYPRLYGTPPPSFSRAVLQRWRDTSLLWISATASIVGHATAHADDASAQFDETLANIQALRERSAGARKRAGRAISYRLYVRERSVLAALSGRQIRELSSEAGTLVLVADFCRPDLLLEIEALHEYAS